MIYVAADHFGTTVAEAVVAYAQGWSLPVQNVGAQSSEEPLALEEMIPRLVNKLREDPVHTGVLICGTGVGVEIGANRFAGVRATLCTNPEQAGWARQYDNANVLCLPGWRTPLQTLPPILQAWFSTEFDGDPARTQMLTTFDSWVS